MSKEQKEYIEGLRGEIRQLHIELDSARSELENKNKQLYSSEFIYFLVSLVLPLGWSEVSPLMLSHDSIWHVVVGFVFWLPAILLGCHILWRWFSFRRVPKIVGAGLVAFILGGFIFAFNHALSSFKERLFEEREQSAFQNLHASVKPAPTGKIVDTIFTLTNDSPERISFMALCGTHKVVGDGGTKSIAELSVTDLTFGGQLGPGGDSKSGQCVAQINALAAGLFAPINHIQCADVELLVKYSLADVPARERKKSIRFVGFDSSGQYIWMQQPTSLEKGSYCDALIRRPPQP